MFATLVVSRPAALPRARFLVPAALIHAAILSAAVRATVGDPVHPTPASRDTIHLFSAPVQHPTMDEHPAGPATGKLREFILPLREIALPQPPQIDLSTLARPDLGSVLKALSGVVGDPSGLEPKRAILPVVEDEWSFHL